MKVWQVLEKIVTQSWEGVVVEAVQWPDSTAGHVGA